MLNCKKTNYCRPDHSLCKYFVKTNCIQLYTIKYVDFTDFYAENCSLVWKSDIKHEHDISEKINIFPSNQRFTKELISRHFLSMIATSTQRGNYGNLFSLFSGKNFVKVTFLLKKLLNK